MFSSYIMFLGKNSPCWVVWQGLSVSHLYSRSYFRYPSLAANTKEAAKSVFFVYHGVRIFWKRPVTQCVYFRFDYILQHRSMNGEDRRWRWKNHSRNIPIGVNRWGAWAWACHWADLKKKKRTGENRGECVAVGSSSLSITVSHLYQRGKCLQSPVACEVMNKGRQGRVNKESTPVTRWEVIEGVEEPVGNGWSEKLRWTKERMKG